MAVIVGLIIDRFRGLIMLATIQQACSTIKSKPSHINNLGSLLEGVSLIPDPAQQLQCLQQIFNTLKGFLQNLQRASDQPLRLFIYSKLLVLATFLIELFLHEAQPQAYDLLSQLYGHCDSPTRAKVVNHFMAEVKHGQVGWGQFCDADMATQLISQTNTITNNGQQLPSFVLQFVLQLPALPQMTGNTSAFKQAYQELVMKLLSNNNLPRQELSQFYHGFGTKVLSKFQTPLITAQFFLTQFQSDIETQIQVLACLFILSAKYEFDVERFYQQLEILIQKRENGKSVYQFRNSKRFFKLVESALRSSKVPFQTVYRMVTIIMRQIMEESGRFSFWALALLVNLTKKHRKLADYLKDIPELELLKRHHSPKVRELLGELQKNLTQSDFLDIDQFSRITCERVLDQKVQQTLKSMDSEYQFRAVNLYEAI